MAAKRKASTAEPKLLSIKQVKSGIGRPEVHRATLRALGFRKHQQTIVQKDSPAIRGMLFHVRHLVEVQEIAEGEA